MRRSARSINVCERTDGLWGLPPEVMCRVQRGKTWYSGSAGVYCRRTRVKMEILVEGSLNKFSGHEQMVRSSSSFAIVAQALDEGGKPQPGVVVNLFSVNPGVAASCGSPLVATDSQGLVVISCNASTVSDPTIESILINDSFGRAPVPPFTVSIVPLVPGREGLQKLTGDGQVVTEGESFSTTFKVTDFVSTVPQEDAVISVSSEPSGVVSCVTSNSGLVDDVGEAAFTCSALDVAENTVVLISVSDNGGRTIADPFAATVVGEDVPVSGLTKLSGDNQTVLQNSAFPDPLRVSDRFGGELQEDVVLTVNTTPSGVVFCSSGVLTDSSGVGTINCNAGAVGSTTPVQISVTDEFLQELDVPFSATVLTDAPTEEGLNKVSGDNQVAPRNSVLPVPLVVSAVLDGEPQADLALSVSTTDQFLLLCPLAEMTGPNGLASINCSTGSVVVPTDVQVLVSDDLGRSLPSPFKVTVVPTSSEDVDSLTLLSESFLEVLVGETVEDAIEVRALDADDDPVAGAAIFFSSDRDATFDPLVALTGFNGRTETSVTFGCFSGLGTIDIALEPDGDAQLSVGFRASPGLAGLITKVQGDNQSGSPGQLLNQIALVARVTDICENPIQGAAVTWTVEPPEAATLINTISTTDGQGRSSTLVQLGNRPGPFTITATSGSLTPAVFNLTVEVDATQLAIVSGNNQTLALGETTPLPLVVETRDDNNQGVPGVEVTFAVIQGSATITADTTVVTNALGRAQVFVQAGTVLGTIRIGASAFGENVSFTINTIGRLPQVTSLGFVNGASFRQGWVPGSAGSIFGVGLMEGVDGIVLPPDFPLPDDLARCARSGQRKGSADSFDGQHQRPGADQRAGAFRTDSAGNRDGPHRKQRRRGDGHRCSALPRTTGYFRDSAKRGSDRRRVARRLFLGRSVKTGSTWRGDSALSHRAGSTRSRGRHECPRADSARAQHRFTCCRHRQMRVLKCWALSTRLI